MATLEGIFAGLSPKQIFQKLLEERPDGGRNISVELHKHLAGLSKEIYRETRKQKKPPVF